MPAKWDANEGSPRPAHTGADSLDLLAQLPLIRLVDLLWDAAARQLHAHHKPYLSPWLWRIGMRVDTEQNAVFSADIESEREGREGMKEK